MDPVTLAVATKRAAALIEPFTTSLNKFDGTYITATLRGDPGANPHLSRQGSGRVGVAPVQPGKTYTVSHSGGVDRFRLAAHSVLPDVPPNPGAVYPVDVYIGVYDESTEVTVTIPDGMHYLLVYVSQIGFEPEWVQVEEGDSATPFVPASVKFVRQDRIIPPISNGAPPPAPISKPPILIADMPASPYAPTPEPRWIEPVNDVDALYGVYDALVASHPEYVSRTLLANDESGKPIYRYDFTPVSPVPFGHSAVPHPKVLYVTGIHGHEIVAMFAVATLFEAICEDWHDNDVLRSLRWNTHFIVIPALNPWGVDENERKNSLGVDVNRNFPPGWEYEPDPLSTTYAGEEPLEAVGAQVIKTLVESEPGIVLAVDHHNWNRNPVVDGIAFWVGTIVPELVAPLTTVSQLMQARIDQFYDYDAVPPGVNYWVRGNAGGTMARYFGSEGLNGMILETVRYLTVVSSPESTQVGQIYTTDVVGNVISGLLRVLSRR